MSNLRAALASSLDQETTSFRSRLERAAATLKTPALPTNGETKTIVDGDVRNDVENEQKPNTVVRDSFTMPEDDYSLISQVRQRSLKCGVAITKAEVLRAGLKALDNLKDDELMNVISSLQKVKTGRPNAKKQNI